MYYLCKIKSQVMKKILLFLLLSILYGCYPIYEEPPYINLSGEYVIDRIVITNTGTNNTGSGSMVFLPGDIYTNPNETLPMNYIKLGITRWSFDHALVRFTPTSNGTSTQWQHTYFYSIINPMSVYGNGMVEITNDINFTHRLNRKFYIVDKNYQSLTLRTTGNWILGEWGPNQTMVLYLTRVGP
jgi:hypothetical protein